MFEKYQLKNKMNIVLVPQTDTMSATFMVMYPVGSRYETESLRGASHYVEHLMFKGTQKRKNTLILTREIDRLGAQYNAFTGKEYTAYYIKVDAKFSGIALDILSDMLNNSKFDPKEMEREKNVIVEELRMYRDNPLMNIDNLFEELLFQGSTLGRDIGGTDKHVLNFDRKEVMAYHDKYYSPRNATLVVAGKIDEKLKRSIEQYFDAYESGGPLKRAFKPSKFGPSARKDRLIIQEKVTDQIQLMLGWPAFARGDDRNYALGVLNTILGGSMSSRLFIQVRERRGLAYTVRSGNETFRDAGYCYVRAGLDPKNINKTIGVIKSEIMKLLQKGVTDKELRDAKTHVRGALTLSLEDSETQANWYAREAVLHDHIATPEEELQKLEAVTKEDIKKVGKMVFDWSKTRVAIIGPVKEDQVVF